MKFRIWSWMGSRPQNFMVKTVCKLIYFMGLGDCWYEKTPRSRSNKIMYRIWIIIVHTYIIVVLIDECLAFHLPTLTVKDNNLLKQYIVGKSSIYLKAMIFCYQKKKIRSVLKKLLNSDKDAYTNVNIERASVKKALIYCIILVVMILNTLLMDTIENLISYIREGIPFSIIITYYPPPRVTGKYIDILRFFVELHYWYMATIMIVIDSLSYCSLIFVEYKFKLLQSHFRNLRTKFLENSAVYTQEELEEELKRGFVKGIQLHENALWCAKNVQSTLGNIYSVQVFQNTLLLVNSLIKFVTVEADTTFLLANTSFFIAMVFLTGTYMMSSGDITWEASNVSDAIFDSGWELCRYNVGLRTLAVMAIQRSQVPVYMTAFGVIVLSYSNFLSLLRSSYSFFAVMY